MKKQMFFGILVTTVFLLTSVNASNKNNSQIGEEKYNKIVDNLIKGAESKNNGLKISSTFHLGEFKASKSVISLMRILHDDKSEDARISAALALIKVGDARGIYAVKRAAIYDDSERVKRLCEKFYKDHYIKSKKS